MKFTSRQAVGAQREAVNTPLERGPLSQYTTDSIQVRFALERN